MKKMIFAITLVVLSFITFFVNAADYNSFYSPHTVKNEVRFIFLATSGVIINTSQGTVIIDPAMYLEDEGIDQLKKGGLDLILITHEHFDHYSAEGTRKIFEKTGAHVVAESKVAKNLKGKISKDKITAGKPGETYTFGNIAVKTIEGEHVGPIVLYQIKIGDITIFHGGDSGYVPLNKYPSDIAFFPTGAPSPTCSPEAASKMAFNIKPSVAVAMHGTDEQQADFKKRVKEKMPKTKVIIPEMDKVIKVKIQK